MNTCNCQPASRFILSPAFLRPSGLKHFNSLPFIMIGYPWFKNKGYLLSSFQNKN
jgi:hypothetical protein